MPKLIINRWGNSLAMRIPSHIVKELGLREGDPVSIEYRDGSLYIRPTPKDDTNA